MKNYFILLGIFYENSSKLIKIKDNQSHYSDKNVYKKYRSGTKNYK